MENLVSKAYNNLKTKVLFPAIAIAAAASPIDAAQVSGYVKNTQNQPMVDVPVDVLEKTVDTNAQGFYRASSVTGVGVGEDPEDPTGVDDPGVEVSTWARIKLHYDDNRNGRNIPGITQAQARSSDPSFGMDQIHVSYQDCLDFMVTLPEAPNGSGYDIVLFPSVVDTHLGNLDFSNTNGQANLDMIKSVWQNGSPNQWTNHRDGNPVFVYFDNTGSGGAWEIDEYLQVLAAIGDLTPNNADMYENGSDHYDSSIEKHLLPRLEAMTGRSAESMDLFQEGFTPVTGSGNNRGYNIKKNGSFGASPAWDAGTNNLNRVDIDVDENDLGNIDAFWREIFNRGMPIPLYGSGIAAPNMQSLNSLNITEILMRHLMHDIEAQGLQNPQFNMSNYQVPTPTQ